MHIVNAPKSISVDYIQAI